MIPYRALQSNGVRRESLLSEGKPQSVSRILSKLRGKAMLGDPERGLARVNSGLSVRCGCGECAKRHDEDVDDLAGRLWADALKAPWDNVDRWFHGDVAEGTFF